MTSDFTILVLLYGDYPGLAERCLRSITETVRLTDLKLRVGLNAVSPTITNWLREWVPDECIWESPENIHKYPMMRQMLFGGGAIETPYTMWFDDDSFLHGYKLNGNPQTYWLNHVERAMLNSDMVGAIYGIPWQGRQREWVQDQAWYTGKDPQQRQKIRFATGGWWTIRTDILYGWDYPWPALDHRGGDVMLGELCYQQNLRLHHFHDGVKINADKHWKTGNSPRRGFDQKPIGFNYDPGVVSNVATAPSSPKQPSRPRIIEL